MCIQNKTDITIFKFTKKKSYKRTSFLPMPRQSNTNQMNTQTHFYTAITEYETPTLDPITIQRAQMHISLIDGKHTFLANT